MRRLDHIERHYKRSITLTTRDVRALQALLIELVDKYLEEPKRAQFVTELDARLSALADNQRSGML